MVQVQVSVSSCRDGWEQVFKNTLLSLCHYNIFMPITSFNGNTNTSVLAGRLPQVPTTLLGHIRSTASDWLRPVLKAATGHRFLCLVFLSVSDGYNVRGSYSHTSCTPPMGMFTMWTSRGLVRVLIPRGTTYACLCQLTVHSKFIHCEP